MEQSFRQYFDDFPGYVSVQDRELKVIEANRRFREDFGDFEGRYCYQVFALRPEKCETCCVENTFREGRSQRCEKRVRCLDGRELSVVVETSPIRDETGEIVAVMEVSTDVTEIKDLEEQQRVGQARYHAMFEEVPCYISIQDRELNIIDANRLHRETFGNFLGCKCYEVYKHREEECVPCIVRDTFRDGEIHVHEEVVASREGETMNVLVHTAPIRNENGDITSVIEMSTDITQIRELQSQLTNIGLLISTISHGIKGLLNGLDGGVYLVNSGMKQSNQERLEQGWEIVLRNVSRIRSMVLDILYYAKDREPLWEEISALDVARDVYEVMAEKAPEFGLQLVREFDEQAGICDADGKAVRSMLMNLMENSFDACRMDGKKHEHKVIFRARGLENHVRFEIEDNGIGMDRETCEKAFSLFFSSKGAEGTGLGLFIADKIATAHGGTIKLKSKVGKGTSFIVEIPRQRHDRHDGDPARET